MKPKILLSLVLCSSSMLFAEPLTLVNTLADRPLFTFEVNGVNQTRTVAPGSRVSLEAGRFSGLGEKKVALDAGATYYLAKFTGTPRLYRLPEDQALILNQSGRPVEFRLVGSSEVEGMMADGGWALGALDQDGSLTATWREGSGNRQTWALQGGTVYRLILTSPDGLGTAVSLVPWE